MPLAICGCPVIPVPSPYQPTAIGLSGKTITLTDNGRTFFMAPGETLLLKLGVDSLNWTITVDRPEVLSRVPDMIVIAGIQGEFITRLPGRAVLTAIGDPPCRLLQPPCMAPSIFFRITVIVQ